MNGVKIGKGSFSEVFLCENSYIVKKIDIKALVRNYSMTQNQSKDNLWNTCLELNSLDIQEKIKNLHKQFKDLIESEIQILSQLDHPNIVKYIDHSVEDDVYYIKMEYCDKGDLSKLVKQGKANKQTIDQLLHEIGKALYYLHKKGIIHRDIKPSNILVKSKTDGGIIFKISDFGFACFDLTKLSDNNPLIDTPLGRKYYKVCGTPYYMAPEIASGDTRFNVKVDVWSFGVCLYEIALLHHPFAYLHTWTELKNKLMDDELQQWIDFKLIKQTCITDNFKKLIRMCLIVDHNKRPDIGVIHAFYKEYITNDDVLVGDERSVENVNDNLTGSWAVIKRIGSSLLRMSLNTDFKKWLFDGKY